MDANSEYDSQREFSIIIGEQENQHDRPLREKSGSSSTSDVTTIDENEVACEIEIHPQPLDHWVEDSYATVVRHTPAITPTTITHVDDDTLNHNTEMNNLIQENLEVYDPHEEYEKKKFDAKLPTRESIEQPRCHACAEVVYPLEALQTIGRVYHKTCFKCHQCQRVLSLGKYSVWEGNPYCEPHYLVLFKAFGHYDSNNSTTKIPTFDTSSHVQEEVSKLERPKSNVTQTLVAKFQGLESANNNTTSTQNSLSQDQVPRKIYFNSNHAVQSSANGEVFPSSGRARQLVERWNKMPQENNNQTVGRISPEINGKSHVINQRKFFPVEPKPLTKKPIEPKPKVLVSELKQNFSPKREDEAYSSSESTESGKITQYHVTTNGKTNEFPTPGITRNLVAKFSALSAAS